jgi:hypothetical protein
MGTSNNFQFVTLAEPVLDLIGERESSNVRTLWIPACTGMTFLEVA